MQKLASVQGSVPTTDQQSVMTGRGKGKETKAGRGREGRAVRPGSSVWRMGFCQSIALLGESKAQSVAEGMSGPRGKQGQGHRRREGQRLQD